MPVGVQSLPHYMSFPAIGIGSGVHRPSLCLPYLVFSIRSYLPLDFNRVSSLRPTYRNPMLWSQRRNSGAHGTENSIKISALAEVEPRTLAFSGRGCCH